MDTLLNLLMAVFFLWVGVACLHRARDVARFVVAFFARASGNPELFDAWGGSGGLVMLVRVFGVMSLINFVLQLYLLTTPAVN